MARRRRPFIANQGAAILLGVGLFGASCFVLWDAWEGRGGKAPALLRLALPV